jgi:hypothetical protein
MRFAQPAPCYVSLLSTRFSCNFVGDVPIHATITAPTVKQVGPNLRVLSAKQPTIAARRARNSTGRMATRKCASHPRRDDLR